MQRFTGVGLGFRAKHFYHIIENLPAVPWFEVLADNYLDLDSIPVQQLLKLREHYPVSLHCVGMSLGSATAPDLKYLQQLQQLIRIIQPIVVSDHLSWTHFGDLHSHDLLPLPYTEESLSVLINNINMVQDYLQQPIMLENASSYLTYAHSTIPEWEFINKIATATGCSILLDINNVYVSATNHGFDPYNYINNINTDKVLQFHLAGFTDFTTHLLDTHGMPVHDNVWELFKFSTQKFGTIPAMIEWDNAIPSFARLWQEAKQAELIYTDYRTKIWSKSKQTVVF